MESIEANKAWRVLVELGVEKHPGSSNEAVELLVGPNGVGYTLPFVQRGNRKKYQKEAFDSIVEHVRRSRKS